MQFADTKSPFLSKGIIGGALAVLAGGAQLIGYMISPADVAELGSAVTGLVSSGAGILAIIGRITASKRIG